MKRLVSIQQRAAQMRDSRHLAIGPPTSPGAGPTPGAKSKAKLARTQHTFELAYISLARKLVHPLVGSDLG